MSLLSRVVPTRLATRLARFAAPLAIGIVGALLLLGIGATALLSPGTLGITAARVADTTPLARAVASQLEERDSDRDGLSDSLENYVYGTDPANWDSSGTGIPDGWLVQFGFDPLDPLVREARGRPPPAETLPAAYIHGYPSNYTPPLRTYYEYAKPADYQPGADAPWWRRGEHADPVAPDPTNTGIPVGWLLHHGVALKDLQPDRVAPGSRGNLTIREAFTHDTDPLESDSDGDGLDDWTEIEITGTDPGRFSTAGTGIADGWMLRFGLDPRDPAAGTADPDRDGLTNFEEFAFSWETLRAEREAQGPQILYTKGLHPLEWQTAQTGIPDGWYVRYGLSPFGEDVDRVIGRASDFEEYRDYVPEGEAALQDITFTVRGAYEYARPDDWNESTKGVWWGGTNPVTLDSDEDGLPDPIEIRGWYANVTFDTGPEAKPRVYRATSNPLEPDSDGDGLTDLEEYRGLAECSAGTTRSFPPTDPRNRDTAFSLVSDHEKVCGVVRGEARYDLAARPGAGGLDPTRADSAGDHVKDGTRLDFWHERGTALRANPRYPYNGSAYRTVFDWTEKYARFGSLGREDTLAQFRPDGDVDGDGIINVADPDPSGGLYAEKFDPEGGAKTKVYFLGGPQIDPSAYRLTEFAAPTNHSATDPANPDTDGDNLPDSWEIRYGRFDPARGGWDLDPAKSDSDGDGVTDDKANNDADLVTWYSFDRRGLSTERTARTFDFTNELEFLAGTNPNEVSTLNDGVPDGWKAFWGSRISSATYPNLVGSRDASLGGVALDKITEIESALAASAISTTANLRNLGAKATGYVRLVNVSACGADFAPLLRAGERVADTNACYSGNNLDNQPIKIARLYGAKKLTYADEARLRTNPYMDDTDGDGAPDAYEAHYLVRTPGGTSYPDPAVDDSARDPDADGLGIRDECGSPDGKRCGFETFRVDDITLGAGADPNAADSDLDAIQDGIESGALLNPLDPSDVESFARADKDSDSDGVPDFQELTGRDAKLFFGEPIRTNPKEADSDGDGLLDGETRNLNPLSATDAPLIANWTARGIAHRNLSNGSIDFLGERTFGPPFGLRPDKMDSGAPGIPDGWLAYYNQNPKERTIEPAPYLAHRPSWWVEALHGVWWWGEPPGTIPPDDLDGDGLHDRNGEDPFPATSRLNRIVDGTAVIRDPKDVGDWVLAGTTPEERRHRAQRAGDGAGDPAAARLAAHNFVDPATNVPVRNLRACVSILDLDAPDVVDKGVRFNVTGRVVLNERASGVCGQGGGALLEGTPTARVGVANRTVLLSVFSPSSSRLIGAGWTNATGHFNLSANITETQRYTLPAEGLILLGAVDGLASTRFDPTQLATGNNTGLETNRIVAWVYNTSATATAGDPTHSRHPARMLDRNGATVQGLVNGTSFAHSSALPVTVRSATRIDFSTPTTIENGARLAGELKLADASGAPLVDRGLALRWGGGGVTFPTQFTDRNGVVNLTKLQIPASVTAPGEYALSATFTSPDPNLLSTEQALAIRVRHPTAFVGIANVSGVTVGEQVVVAGELRTRDLTLADGTFLPSVPVGAAPLKLDLGGITETSATDPNGRFLIRLEVPGSVAAGRQQLKLTFDGDASNAPATTTLPVDVKRTAGIAGLNRLEGPRTIEVALRGRLVDNEGDGFEGVVEVHAERAGMLARGLSRPDGSFTLVVPLEALELGTQPIRVIFPGDVSHAAGENFTQARVTSTTTLSLEGLPPVVVRGTSLPVRVVLKDDEGKPVAAQPVAGFWRGERLEVLVTRADGAATFTVPANASERPSVASFGVDFAPNANSVYQPAAASREIRVVAGVDLLLPDASVPRGPVTIAGRLVDDNDRPLPGTAVALALDGAPIGEARTSRNGTFELVHLLPDDTPLGAHRLSARFAGALTLANATTEATWHVRSPLQVDLTKLGPFVRGENAPIEGRVLDDRGVPVDTTFRLFLAGRDLGVQRASSGKLLTSFQVPADLPRGETTLRLQFAQTDAYEGTSRDVQVVIKIRPKIEVELPTLVFRGFAIGGGVSLLDDKGQPLRNTSYAYVIGRESGAVVGQTNSEGEGALAGVAPLQGDATLALTVRGGSDVVAAQFSSTTMRVVGPATPIGYAVLVLVVLVVLALAGLVVAAVILRRRQLQEARDILDEAIRDLLAGNEYAGTIFLAYRRFTAYLGRHGFVEKASDTPREFALGVRKALPVGAVPLRSLIGLFEEARYSDHPIGSSERDRAVESLTTVRSELDRLLGKRKVAA